MTETASPVLLAPFPAGFPGTDVIELRVGQSRLTAILIASGSFPFYAIFMGPKWVMALWIPFGVLVFRLVYRRQATGPTAGSEGISFARWGVRWDRVTHIDDDGNAYLDPPVEFSRLASMKPRVERVQLASAGWREGELGRLLRIHRPELVSPV